MRKLIAALFFVLASCAPPAYAQTWVKPPNVPTVFVQDYNLTIAVWVQGSVVGNYIAIFELHPDGNWYYGAGDDQYAGHFDGDYANYGATGWVTNIGMPHINPILAARYPLIGGAPTTPIGTDPVSIVNNTLATSFSLKMVNGIPVLGSN